LLAFVTQITLNFWGVIKHIFAIDPQDPLKTGARVAGVLGLAVTVIVTLISKSYPWLRSKIESRSVSRVLGEDLFPPKAIQRAVRYYVPPLCQSVDPAGGEESRLLHSVQAPLFETFDRALSSNSEDKYHILLADSGMGKSSAVINYCVRHQRRWRKKYHVAIVPLGIPDADERIRKIENKAKTSLFLDALDEDTLAIVDHVERMRLLIRDTHEFRKVVITCRTQFFSSDEEIPRETGVIKIAARSAGEPAEQLFYKVYLAPFSDDQISAYLKRRYPMWKLTKRKEAFRMIEKIPLLSARPMLLAHVDDLLRSNAEFRFSYQLYEEMVESWIRREKGFIKEPKTLREFSERLAADLYLNRARRGTERITKPELINLAQAWGTPISDDKLSARSLLNRDAEGNFKFAHRSIMEYLFVRRFLDGDGRCACVDWTDQMNTFIWEMLKENTLDLLSGGHLLPEFSELRDQSFLSQLLKFVADSGFSDPPRPDEIGALAFLCSAFLESDGINRVVVEIWEIAGIQTVVRPPDSPPVRILRVRRGLQYTSGSIGVPHTLDAVMLPSKVTLLDIHPGFSLGQNGEVHLREVVFSLRKNKGFGRWLAFSFSVGGRSLVLIARADDRFSTFDEQAMMDMFERNLL